MPAVEEKVSFLQWYVTGYISDTPGMALYSGVAHQKQTDSMFCFFWGGVLFSYFVLFEYSFYLICFLLLCFGFLFCCFCVYWGQHGIEWIGTCGKSKRCFMKGNKEIKFIV